MNEQHRITTQDGIDLFSFYQKAETEHLNPPTVFWLHGAFEHSFRYQYPIKRLAEQGFASVAYDQRGHGQSKGKKMVIRSFMDYVNDLTRVYQYYLPQIKGDVFLVGHSMGALVAVRFLQEYPHLSPFKACVLSAPFMGLKAEVPAWKKLLSGLVVRLNPEFSLPTALDVGLLSRDPQVGRAYAKDPLVSKTTTAIWFEETMKSCLIAIAKANQVKIPLLLMQAGMDGIADNTASKKFFDRNMLPEKEIKVWEGAYHELFNEINKEQITDYMIEYLMRYTHR